MLKCATITTQMGSSRRYQGGEKGYGKPRRSLPPGEADHGADRQQRSDRGVRCRAVRHSEHLFW